MFLTYIWTLYMMLPNHLQSAETRTFVQLPAGDIPLTETRVFGPESSNKIFRGADDGSTRFVGAIRVTGWEACPDGLWKAHLPKGADGKPIYTEQLFVNSRRAQRSRFPESGFFKITSASFDKCPESPTGTRIYASIDADSDVAKLLDAAKPEELRHAQFLAHVKWDVTRYPISGWKDGRLAVDGFELSKIGMWTDADFYAIENLRTAFTKPGQWFLDVDAGEILYRPLDGEVIKEALVPVDGLATLVSVSGAENVAFENVAFAFTSATTSKGPTRINHFQAAVEAATAAVVVDKSSAVSFRNCRFEHTGGYALWFREGCRGGGAFSCEMTDLGAGGVRIGTYQRLHATNIEQRPEGCTSDVPYVETAPWMTSHISVDNCLVAHGGRFHPAGVGVFLTHASDCTVTHNEIHDLFYTGISVGWIWGYAGSPSQRNTIAYNLVYDIGQNQLADMGGIYLLGTAFGTCVSNNVVHGIHSYSYGGWGLYPDEGSEGIVLENNLVYDTDDASFHQHYGKDNVLRNNILVDSKAGQVAVTRDEPHRSVTVERNIVIWSNGDAFNKYQGTKSEKAVIDWRKNLWWRADGVDEFNGTPFADWRGRVKDEGSLFADPLFVDWRKGDFTLSPDSPALKLGFKPFDPAEAGRRKPCF